MVTIWPGGCRARRPHRTRYRSEARRVVSESPAGAGKYAVGLLERRSRLLVRVKVEGGPASCSAPRRRRGSCGRQYRLSKARRTLRGSSPRWHTWARLCALGALRRIGRVDGDARPRGDPGPRHLQRVELRRRLEHGPSIVRVGNERDHADGIGEMSERQAAEVGSSGAGSGIAPLTQLSDARRRPRPDVHALRHRVGSGLADERVAIEREVRLVLGVRGALLETEELAEPDRVPAFGHGVDGPAFAFGVIRNTPNLRLDLGEILGHLTCALTLGKYSAT
eukprot:scaffold85035_cov64-Phaeocystis_antarctica.AAC.4